MKNFKTHQLTHSRKPSFTCRICNIKVKTKWYLNKHEKLHTGIKPNECPKCKKCFTELLTLKGHLERNQCKDLQDKNTVI